MFLMPVAMITIMAVIQDAPFRDYQELKIPLLLVNNDNGNLDKAISSGLKDSKIFEITIKAISPEEARRQVKAGDYEIGILIPENASASLESRVGNFVNKKLTEAGLEDTSSITPAELPPSELQVFFAPDTKKSFQASVLGSIKQSTSKIETQTLLAFFSRQLNKNGAEVTSDKPMESFIGIREVSTIETPAEALKLNSVQHNVPAWTIFGMFFIVISMAGSIIKERDDGSYTRILSMPGSYITVLAGKITAYLLICMIQCVLMLMVGIYLLPHLGLPTLVTGTSLSALILVALSTGLAATGYGVMIGSIFKTHQQSSTFGAVSVVILAALGGIWVPVYVMPEAIRMFAEFSPLYWSLTAFHKIFLNDGNVQSVLPFILKLIIFFLITLFISWSFNRTKNR